MLKYIKTGVLINKRTFSSLRVNKQPRFIYRNDNILSRGSISLQSRNISTVEGLYLKVISLPPVHYIEDSLAYIHDTTGLPWWASLIVSTGLFRLVLTLPAHITQQKVSAKRFLMNQEMKNEVLPAIQKMTDR